MPKVLRAHDMSKCIGCFTSVCLACREPACAEVCPTAALLPRKGGGVTLKKELCIGCRRCLGACTALAVNFDEDTGKPIICRHCGICPSQESWASPMPAAVLVRCCFPPVLMLL